MRLFIVFLALAVSARNQQPPPSPCTTASPCRLTAQVSTAHHATLYYQSASCTTSTLCKLTVYRNVCASTTNCPSFGNGHGWTPLSYGTGTANPTATGTTWIVQDQDPVLKDNTTYVYAAKLAWASSPNQMSSPGARWIGTTSGGSTSNAPPAPTVGANNTVQ